jgi:hypothetical protein
LHRTIIASLPRIPSVSFIVVIAFSVRLLQLFRVGRLVQSPRSTMTTLYATALRFARRIREKLGGIFMLCRTRGGGAAWPAYLSA